MANLLEPCASQAQRILWPWQRRFWDHVIRDDDDYVRHMDYTHYNPVKHGLVTEVKDWPYSTFHHLVEVGLYPQSWGENIDLKVKFGERA